MYGQSYGDSIGIFEMSQVKGDRFAFSYRERNKREVSIKNVKIEDGKAFAQFEYQKARYDCKFVFKGQELVLLTTQYEHDDYGRFAEVYSFQGDKMLNLLLFKFEDGHKYIIHKLESEISK